MDGPSSCVPSPTFSPTSAPTRDPTVSNEFDSHFIIQISYLIQNITIFFPEYFLLIGGVGSAGINVCMIAIGSVNYKCLSILGDDKLGEIYSKIAAQNSLSLSLGMSLGGLLCLLIPNNFNRLIFINPVVAVLDMTSYYLSIKNVLRKIEEDEEPLVNFEI